MEIWHLAPDTPRLPRHPCAGEPVQIQVGTRPVEPGQSVWAETRVRHAKGYEAIRRVENPGGETIAAHTATGRSPRTHPHFYDASLAAGGASTAHRAPRPGLAHRESRARHHLRGINVELAGDAKAVDLLMPDPADVEVLRLRMHRHLEK